MYQKFIQLCGDSYPKIKQLLDLLKEYNLDLYAHSFRTAYYAYRIAKVSAIYSDEFIYELVIGAVLHDFGKLKVDLDVLQKPGVLTPLEFKSIQEHPYFGYDFLDTLFSPGITQIALMHHEKLDGSGYPFGLTTIPEHVQIVTVADMFDAMTSRRVYKQTFSSEEALLQLQEDVKVGKLNSRYVAALSTVMQIPLSVPSLSS